MDAAKAPRNITRKTLMALSRPVRVGSEKTRARYQTQSAIVDNTIVKIKRPDVWRDNPRGVIKLTTISEIGNKHEETVKTPQNTSRIGGVDTGSPNLGFFYTATYFGVTKTPGPASFDVPGSIPHAAKSKHGHGDQLSSLTKTGQKVICVTCVLNRSH